MRLHREGNKIIMITIGIMIILNFLAHYYFPELSYLQLFIGLVSLVFLGLVLNFFRNPKRYTEMDQSHVIAPADGKVVVIEEVEEPEYFKDKRTQVSIFMSPTNVHANRNPVSGVVKYTKYHPGKYLVAWHPKSSTMNERNTIVIQHDNVEVLVRQIAGALARRIVSYLSVGQEIMQGEEFGFIKFGSRVDVFLPVGTKVNVALNQKVKGGVTILAELN